MIVSGSLFVCLFFAMPGLALNLFHRGQVIFGEVLLFVTFGAMCVPRIRTAHACFRHTITSFFLLLALAA